MKTLRMGLIGKKLGMTQIFSENIRIPVTVIQAGPCPVIQKKSQNREKYSSVQIGFDRMDPKKANKPLSGHFKKSGLQPCRAVREIRLSEEDASKFEIGQEISVDKVFSAGDLVDVSGSSKGKGFTGVIKRHNFRSFPETHGTHEVKRHGGSIGSQFPQHTRKGKRMAGQHGNQRKTVQNIEVIEVRPEENLLLVRGGIPGARGGYVLVRKAVKA